MEKEKEMEKEREKIEKEEKLIHKLRSKLNKKGVSQRRIVETRSKLNETIQRKEGYEEHYSNLIREAEKKIRD